MSKILQIGDFWIHEEEYEALKQFHNKCRKWQYDFLIGNFESKEQEDKETFYYVNLANSDDSVHTLGMKSRKTGKIYLTKEYEVDLNSPIENTDFHYVRDSTTFDL